MTQIALRQMRITVTLQGNEVGKWLQNKQLSYGNHRLAPDVIALNADAPIYRDIGDEAESDLPYVGEGYVTLGVMHLEATNTIDAAILALERIREVISNPEKLLIQVESYKGEI